MVRRLPGFLDESVKQHQAAFLGAKEDASDSAIPQVGSYFPQALSALQRSTERHSDRPTELDSSYIVAD